MTERNGFIIHEESYRSFERLSDERLGRLFRAMYLYASGEPAHTFPEDEVLDIIFENIRERMDRDAVRYDEMCRKNAENGRKGGRPKKTDGFSKKAKKTERFFEKPKKAKCECDSDSECECDPDPECDPVCECEPECDARARGEQHTAHTAHTAETAVRTVSDVLELAGKLGYAWDRQEAENFLAYNLDKGRKRGWGFAARKWEENREKRHHGGEKKPSRREIDEMNDYLSMVNNFRQEDAT